MEFALVFMAIGIVLVLLIVMRICDHLFNHPPGPVVTGPIPKMRFAPVERFCSWDK